MRTAALPVPTPLINDCSFHLLRTLIKCYDREYLPETVQRGDFWVLKNYIRADHGPLRCFETITYTTHADYTFLDNLIPLLERWLAPLSIALHAPGTDYAATVNSIKYLRECAPEAHLVRQFVTFHVYFSSKHIPRNVSDLRGWLVGTTGIHFPFSISHFSLFGRS